jgi:hypothetical protein
MRSGGAIIAVLMVAGSAAAASRPLEAPLGTCLKTVVPQQAGSLPNSADFIEVACPPDLRRTAFSYDRVRRFTRISREIEAGEIVHRYPEFGRDMVKPGDRLMLVVSSGPVRVEQVVTALQAAQRGTRLFVRRSDGTVLSTEYAGRAP